MAVMTLSGRLFLAATVIAALAVAQKKYTGPRPPKPDVPYLLHATNLIETETGEAREEKRKDEVANIMRGANSPARTPLAEPIFLMQAEKLQPERIELYKVAVKNGNREVSIPSNAKRRRDGPRPLRLSVSRLDGGLYRIEANQWLDNGEYCLSPAGSQQVFCFQVY